MASRGPGSCSSRARSSPASAAACWSRRPCASLAVRLVRLAAARCDARVPYVHPDAADHSGIVMDRGIKGGGERRPTRWVGALGPPLAALQRRASLGARVQRSHVGGSGPMYARVRGSRQAFVARRNNAPLKRREPSAPRTGSSSPPTAASGGHRCPRPVRTGSSGSHPPPRRPRRGPCPRRAPRCVRSLRSRRPGSAP